MGEGEEGEDKSQVGRDEMDKVHKVKMHKAQWHCINVAD